MKGRLVKRGWRYQRGNQKR